MIEPKAADYDWMAEARAEAFGSWAAIGALPPENGSRLAEEFALRLARWMRTAARHASNEQFWRGWCATLEDRVAANPVDHPKPMVFHSMEGWKTMKKEESPPPPGLSRREQVWLSAWCARAGSSSCASASSGGAIWADECLSAFDARFPDPTGGKP